MDKLLKTFGTAVRERRAAIGLSQEQLADRCGFDRTYISMLERGVRSPSLLNLAKLANGLGITLSELMEACDGS
jgi:transcriptional regulator with XRE-family HTH domain